tara:strand:+ start:489 stop:884 length:396 start_codon:yes stop_codon:yes gene_type:complete
MFRKKLNKELNDNFEDLKYFNSNNTFIKRLLLNPYDNKEPDEKLILNIKRFSKINTPSKKYNYNIFDHKIALSSITAILLIISFFMINNDLNKIKIYENQLVDLNIHDQLVTHNVLTSDEIAFFYMMMNMK